MENIIYQSDGSSTKLSTMMGGEVQKGSCGCTDSYEYNL